MTVYKCPKCGRIWQYPITLCPYCIIGLDRIESEQFKIIGSSKVSIPTIMHPHVPFSALIVEDENKNKWAFKSAEEKNIGEQMEFTPNDNENAVAIWRVKYDFADTVKKAVELLGGLNLNENSKILILPTLSSLSYSYMRENTSPEFLDGVLKFLFSKNIKPENIKIGSQSFDETPIEAIAQKSGLLGACLKNKITPIDLAKKNFIKLGEFQISEEAAKADLVLNLSILKIGAAKTTENIFRIMKKENYLSQKYLRSEKEIADELSKILPNSVSLGEAETVQKETGYLVFLGLILASKNHLNLDRVFNAVTAAKNLPETIKEIQLGQIPIIGRQIADVKFDVADN
ncbi:MAG: hypothetical protein PHG23_02120 [Candidatus Pacebacteria bacterium]|nr:hypothetical protein [Candidatus Paceibacterota bacterium]